MLLEAAFRFGASGRSRPEADIRDVRDWVRAGMERVLRLGPTPAEVRKMGGFSDDEHVAMVKAEFGLDLKL